MLTRQRSLFSTLFTEHPASVGETYWQHMAFAFRFAAALFVAGGAAVVHAVFPALCESTASRKIKELHAIMEARH